MPVALLCAHFADKELALPDQARADARPILPEPAARTRALALAIWRSRPGCGRPASWSGSVTPACGKASVTACDSVLQRGRSARPRERAPRSAGAAR
jgi:hypothetical protein